MRRLLKPLGIAALIVSLLVLAGCCFDDVYIDYAVFDGALVILVYGGSYGDELEGFLNIPIPGSSEPQWSPEASNTTANVEGNGNSVSTTAMDSSSSASTDGVRNQPRTTTTAVPELFVPDGFSHGVVVFNATTFQKLATITLPGQPYDLAISPDQSTIYAVVFPMNSSQQPSVAVIDTVSQQITSTIALPANTYPFWSALSPDGSTLYVFSDGVAYGTAPNNLDSLLVIDTASGTVTKTLTNLNVAGRPYVTPDGTLLIFTVTAIGEANMTAIDTTTMTQAWTVSEASSTGFFTGGLPPPHVVFSTGGRYAYALGTAFSTSTGTFGSLIYQVDVFQGKVVNTIPVGTASSNFSDLAISANGRQLLAADTGTGNIYVVHLPDNKVVQTFQGTKIQNGHMALLPTR